MTPEKADNDRYTFSHIRMEKTICVRTYHWKEFVTPNTSYLEVLSKICQAVGLATDNLDGRQ